MPPLAHQHCKLGNTFTARFLVLRLLTPLGIFYEAASSEPSHITTIRRELPDMRADTIALVKQAVAEERATYVAQQSARGKCAAHGSSVGRHPES
ncbi:hypothetical protein [Nitrospira sp. Nam74]